MHRHWIFTESDINFSFFTIWMVPKEYLIIIKQKDKHACVIRINIYNTNTPLLVVRVQHNSSIWLFLLQLKRFSKPWSRLPLLLNITIFFRSWKPTEKQTLKGACITRCRSSNSSNESLIIFILPWNLIVLSSNHLVLSLYLKMQQICKIFLPVATT